MIHTTRMILVPVLLTSLLAGAAAKKAGVHAAPSKSMEVVELAGEGKKNALPDGYWFTWQFDKTPQLGTSIMKIRVFDRDGRQNTAFEVFGETGMPSMREHDTGPVRFQTNKKGDYLMPVNVVMPGGWQIVVRIKRAGKEIFAGKVNFRV